MVAHFIKYRQIYVTNLNGTTTNQLANIVKLSKNCETQKGYV